MRYFMSSLIVVSCFAVSLAFANAQVQEKVTPQRVAELVGKLGSPKFAERENAMKELEALGFTALPSLRPALKSPDAEVRRRVEILVRKFEDQELTTKLLTAKMVHLKLKDATIAEAVAGLEKQSYPIDLPDDIKNNTDIKITLDTGDTSFWQALHQICLKALGSEAYVIKTEKMLKSTWDPWNNTVSRENVSQVAATIPLGKLASNPVSFAGSVRIMLLKVSQAATGIDLVLDVSCEPHFLDITSAATPTVSKVVDEHGQKLNAVLVIDQAAPAKAAAIANNIAIQRAAFTTPMPSQPRSGFQSFQTTLRLKHEAKPSKEIKEITGKIPVRTILETEPEFVVDNILKAAGQSIKSKGDKTLHVLGVEPTANGEVIVKVGIETANAQNAVAAGAVVRVQQIQAIQAVKNANGANVLVPAGIPTSSLRLFDAAGKAFVQKAQMGGSATFTAGKMTQIETVVFTPSEGQGAAARLVLPGYRPFEFEVPFSFKDVELR